MDLRAYELKQASSLHWTNVSAMVCFLFAGAVLAVSLLPPAQKPQLSRGDDDHIAVSRH